MRRFPSFHASPGFKLGVMLGLFGLYLAAGLVAWLTLVPGVLSAPTFAWFAALACLIAIATGATLVRARSTQTIAHVLYDVEHPSRSSRF